VVNNVGNGVPLAIVLQSSQSVTDGCPCHSPGVVWGPRHSHGSKGYIWGGKTPTQSLYVVPGVCYRCEIIVCLVVLEWRDSALRANTQASKKHNQAAQCARGCCCGGQWKGSVCAGRGQSWGGGGGGVGVSYSNKAKGLFGT
jgi:hypothetical protein